LIVCVSSAETGAARHAQIRSELNLPNAASGEAEANGAAPGKVGLS
jgi:hypothetical protein